MNGNKPDFHKAMPPDRAKSFYEKFVQNVKANYKEEAVKDGVFGAMMKLALVNDGPVTITLESSTKEEPELPITTATEKLTVTTTESSEGETAFKSSKKGKEKISK